jgi:hypothetical protein
VRTTPCRPRSWANSSFLQLYPHRNAWANLHLLGQPNTVLAAAGAASSGGCSEPQRLLGQRRYDTIYFEDRDRRQRRYDRPRSVSETAARASRGAVCGDQSGSRRSGGGGPCASKKYQVWSRSWVNSSLL